MTQARCSIYIGVSVYKDQGAIGIAVYDDTQTLSGSHRLLIDRPTDCAELELIACIEGLRYAIDGDVIYSSSEFCVRGYNEWLDDWKRRGWRKSDKKPVANRQLWQQVDEERSRKLVEVCKRRSSPELDFAYQLAKGLCVVVN
ncbi:ribonuclease H [Vibrio fluvialis]|nr:ribonuclease H [Vibrio fluvialis]